MHIDHTNICPWPRTDWRDQLQHGDIVSFRFPVGEKSSDGAFEPRPCLVLGVGDKAGRKSVLLAYGTTGKVHSGRGYETQVSRRRELRLAGLDQPMRFIGAHRLLVPLNHNGFVLGTAGSPRLGTLTGSALERMNAVRARLLAEYDIAADRRCAQKVTCTANNANRALLRIFLQKPERTNEQAKRF